MAIPAWEAEVAVTAPRRQDGEGELLAALRRGEAKAFERLLRAHNRLLFRAARGIVKDDAEAQDVVQETWLRAFLSLGSFRGDASLATWLVRIAIHQALGRQRSLGRRAAWCGSGPDLENDMPHADDPARSDGHTPEDEAWRGELRRRLEDAIDLLPPIYRCVFILRAVQGLSVEETAAALDVTLDVVRTRYLRARGMLRGRLDDLADLPLSAAHDFRGQRCEDMVSDVLASLHALGIIRHR
ncbi:RNA polymerase sigma factor [Ramlibacter algicola]|uniref:RNA polymerase sigma factor n=1 Tax=Ramlibacter algicola TaxID=2795217 RepID=A0A934UTN2_9BURK|nr:RNA polymerase sigma factor [Ramlibacter algicola]MBK0394702.1 RNA polymerase sigma factor [Ramlibacter algicola]